MYVTKEQKQHAIHVDLATWLLKNHPDEVKHQYGSVILIANDHVSVKDGYSGYCNFRTGDTGNSIDYLMNYLGYNYVDAVIALTRDKDDCLDHGYTSGDDIRHLLAETNRSTSKSDELILPAPADSYSCLYAYLTHRCIPVKVIKILVDRGILYQSANHNNAVFVNPEHDYAEIRGTNTYADRRCRNRNKCNQYEHDDHMWCTQMNDCDRYKPDPYHGCRKTKPDRFWYFAADSNEPHNTVFICEAAIDAVSLYVMRKRGGESHAVYVSIGGVANQKTIDRIKQRHSGVVIATDNDKAGDECRERNAELQNIRPNKKDWNEDLREEYINVYQ